MEMTVNARDQEQHGLGLGLSLSLSIATAHPVEPPPQRAISVAPISSHPAPPMPPQPQWWSGAGLFFSHSSGTDRSLQPQALLLQHCHAID